MAYYDILTGLYNRNYFVRLLGEFVRKAKEENGNVAVMFIDLDDFRKMNDGLGIIVGDEIVQLFGQFLSELANDNIVISKWFAEKTNTEKMFEEIYYRCKILKERIDKTFKGVKE